VDRLRFTPCLPAEWPGFTMHYRYRETVYHIAVQRPTAEKGSTHVTVDGVDQHDNIIPLVDDRQEHYVEVSPLVRSQTQN
jgi:cyclic beta-1,2-glucan synthetase